jgi:hypothetical protein
VTPPGWICIRKEMSTAEENKSSDDVKSKKKNDVAAQEDALLVLRLFARTANRIAAHLRRKEPPLESQMLTVAADPDSKKQQEAYEALCDKVTQEKNETILVNTGYGGSLELVRWCYHGVELQVSAGKIVVTGPPDKTAWVMQLLR